MADNKPIKEVNQTPPSSQDPDDNRRRTRSQTRNGGLTPTAAPVVEPRGRKRGQSQPGSGGKRGRKSAATVAQPEEHSKKQPENQDLFKKDESAPKEPERIQQEKVDDKDTDVEMKTVENDKEKAVEDQKEEKIEEVHPKETQAKEQKKQEKKVATEIAEQDGRPDEDEKSQKVEPPKPDNQSPSEEKKTDDQIAKTVKQGKEKLAKEDDQLEKVTSQELPKNDKDGDESTKDVGSKDGTEDVSDSKEHDESSKLDTVAQEKVVEEQNANEEKKEGGDNETPAKETAQAIST